MLIMFSVILINNFIHLMQRSSIQIAVTRADIARTSVKHQPNSIPTKFLLTAPKEVFTSKLTNPLHGLLNPEFQCRIHKGFSIVSIVCRINPIFVLIHISLNIHCNIVLPFAPRPS